MPDADFTEFEDEYDTTQNVLGNTTNGPVANAERIPNAFVPNVGDKLLDELQEKQLVIFYQDCNDVKKALSRIKNARDTGLGTGYYRHACWILDSRGLRRRKA